jgi:hypothetical protein
MKRTTLGWLTGAILLLAFPARFWIRAAPPRLLTAATPLDATDPAAARQWLFLSRTRATVPRGATYTVIAPTKDVEMNLFMLSLGLLPEAQALPSSYYGVPASEGNRARFVLVYEEARRPEGLRLRESFPEGKVFERSGAPR